ncbi:UDP-N-acetylmuramoyl-L-alanyl-D-glutamate--2,6-diaminopimelate ligase [Corynebacterium vitaeruminis]|uniref:UDP-N-acetylmuramoyl-L-alanyl-D-glutamate--2, 6-diaminopimelate ligase n=1 Tax=Corynebacterium vitaeruminis TaxID=38305 RepID=UPI0023F403DD|nr:UDP-N-acetylmuramoyl-L-alanyl-D-glutamate--2,6-diaminopimelate ligase [Corynebacterium vitaeruminis]
MTATLSSLVEVAGGRLEAPSGESYGDLAIAEIGLDSTQLPSGGLFAALPGTRSHGASFAASTPAAAVLTDEAGLSILQGEGYAKPVIVVDNVRDVLGFVAAEIYGHPSRDMTIIGVTGTSGKTTTSYLIESGLIAAGANVGLIGTTGTRINGEPVPTKLTTPEATTLQALFSRMRDRGVTHVVMEVSSHALSLGRVRGTDFDVAGFTNLSQDHLDFHATMEEYFEAKALFFDPASPMCAKKAVICIDDEWGEKMAARAQDPTTCTTVGKQADIAAVDIKAEPSGAQRFTLTFADRSLDVELPLPGRFNVANATLALSLIDAVGGDTEAAAKGIAGVGVPGRMEKIDEGQDFLAVVDYAHKPAAVAAVLDTVRAQVDGKLIVVVGAGGDRDAGKRPIMGAEAVRRADLVIITDDNPRSEDPATIRAAVLEGANSALKEEAPAARGTRVMEIGDRREAIREAIRSAGTGDGVVVAGKGHEVGQLIAGVNHHFDDREEVRAALTDPTL